MILWFVAVSALLVAALFRDQRIDYRLVAIGSIAPNVVDAPAGGQRYGHALVSSAVVLVGVVLATRGRPDARRRWLGFPMGLFVHLVLEGGWTHPEGFWWPALGTDFPDARLFPSAAVVVAEEVAGVAAAVWIWRRSVLGDGPRRRALIRSGRLELVA